MLEEVGIQRDERGFTWVAYDLMEHEEQLIEANAIIQKGIDIYSFDKIKLILSKIFCVTLE